MNRVRWRSEKTSGVVRAGRTVQLTANGNRPVSRLCTSRSVCGEYTAWNHRRGAVRLGSERIPGSAESLLFDDRAQLVELGSRSALRPNVPGSWTYAKAFLLRRHPNSRTSWGVPPHGTVPILFARTGAEDGQPQRLGSDDDQVVGRQTVFELRHRSVVGGCGRNGAAPPSAPSGRYGGQPLGPATCRRLVPCSDRCIRVRERGAAPSSQA